MPPETTPAAPPQEALGPNAWLVDEMYDQYRADPSSVSESWREFFADYQSDTQAGSTQADIARPATGRKGGADVASRPAPAPPKPTPTSASAPAAKPAQAASPTGPASNGAGEPQPLRGA